MADGTDSFSSTGAVSGGASFTNNVALNLAAGAGLQVNNSGTSYTANAPLTLGSTTGAVSRVRTGSTFHQNANVTSVGELHVFEPGTTFNLNSGTLAVRVLRVTDGATINRTGGNYNLNNLVVSHGASLSHQGSDAVASTLDLLTGANFTLQKNLTLTGALTMNGSTLNLGGLQASVGSLMLPGAAVVNRGGGGGIQGQSFTISGGASYVADGTDSFSSLGNVMGGASFTNNVAFNLAGAMGLQVNNPGTSYTANAPLTLGNS